MDLIEQFKKRKIIIDHVDDMELQELMDALIDADGDSWADTSCALGYSRREYRYCTVARTKNRLCLWNPSS